MTNRITIRRQELGMTRVELAAALECTTVSVWRWETDKQDPSLETIRDIAKALKTTPNALFPDLEIFIHTQPLPEAKEPVHG